MSKDTRTRKAGLTAISQFLQLGSGMLVALVVTPFIVKAVGAEQYGAWLMFIQVLGYLALIDFGNPTVVRLDLAASQHLKDEQMKREKLGIALWGLVFTAPVYILFAGMMTWGMPMWISVGGLDTKTTFIVCSILALSLFITRFHALPNYALYGENKMYKSTSSRTIVIALTACTDLFVVQKGWGLQGLAVNKALAAVLLFIILFVAARNNVAWWGIKIPDKKTFFSTFQKNNVYMLSVWGSSLAESTDVFIAGFFLGPTMAAMYSLTATAMRLFFRIISGMLGAGGSGFGELFGKKDFKAIERLRYEGWNLALLTFAIGGSATLIGNRSFVDLWVGAKMFAGEWVTLGVFIWWGLLIITRFDEAILKACLFIKERGWVYLVAGIIGVILACLGVKQWGLLGMTLGFAGGRIFAMVGNFLLFENRLDQDWKRWFRETLRALLFCGVCISASFGLSFKIQLNGWMEFFAICCSVAVLVSVGAWFIGMDMKARKKFIGRLKHLPWISKLIR